MSWWASIDIFIEVERRERETPRHVYAPVRECVQAVYQRVSPPKPKIDEWCSQICKEHPVPREFVEVQTLLNRVPTDDPLAALLSLTFGSRWDQRPVQIGRIVLDDEKTGRVIQEIFGTDLSKLKTNF